MQTKIRDYSHLMNLIESNKNISSFLNEYFSFSCMGQRFSHKDKTKIRVKQSAKELIEYLDFLKDKSIESYLEVGIANGGNYLIVSCMLKSYNDNFNYSMGIDLRQICDNTVLKNSDFLNFEFCDCLGYDLNRNYDLIFIDTNQSYSNMTKSFEKYSEHCNKYIAFHDVNDRRYGAKKLFAELSKKYETKHFSNSGAGIGLVIL